MPLKSVVFDVTEDTNTYILSDVLLELGALSVSTTDPSRGTDLEKPAFGEPSQCSTNIVSSAQQNLWPNSRVTALFPLGTDTESLLMSLATDFELHQTPSMHLYTDSFEDKTPEEWVIQAQQSFKPISLKKCVITFPWHDPYPNLCNIIVEPGLAFGTGEHATTRLCGRWIETVVQPGDSVLDFGTGSGVLAIIAAKVADGVHANGIDVDVEAVRAAKENVRRNDVEEAVHIWENKDEPQDKKYDVVVANILAEPLKHLARQLVGKLKRDGIIALSGILTEQAQALRECYQKEGVDMTEANVENGWVLLVGRNYGGND